MSGYGYLEAYGEGQAKRTRSLLRILGALLLAIVLGVFLYFQFRDYSLNRVASQFLKALERKDYSQAYVLWGCTENNPCAHYPYEQFLRDWGPSSSYREAAKAEILNTKSCEGGVLKFVRFPSQPDVLLWIDRKSKSVGFAPWQVKQFPSDFKHRVQGWMWEVTQNCQPLIEP